MPTIEQQAVTNPTDLNTPRIVAVIPAHNEAKCLKDTLAGLQQIQELQAVWVVDDGSTDQTARVARSSGAEVTRLPSNRGKGAALTHAFRAIDADIYLMVDADLGSQVGTACRLLEPILRGRADMSVAVFRRPEVYRHMAGFGVVMATARTGIRWLTGVTVAEPLSGQRALTRRVVEAVCPLAQGYGLEVALTIDALRAGFRVIEVETSLVQVPTGRTVRGFAHRARQLLHVLTALGSRLVWREKVHQWE